MALVRACAPRETRSRWHPRNRTRRLGNARRRMAARKIIRCLIDIDAIPKQIKTKDDTSNVHLPGQEYIDRRNTSRPATYNLTNRRWSRTLHHAVLENACSAGPLVWTPRDTRPRHLMQFSAIQAKRNPGTKTFLRSDRGDIEPLAVRQAHKRACVRLSVQSGSGSAQRSTADRCDWPKRWLSRYVAFKAGARRGRMEWHASRERATGSRRADSHRRR